MKRKSSRTMAWPFNRKKQLREIEGCHLLKPKHGQMMIRRAGTV